MNDQQKKEQYSGVRDQEICAALDQQWAASDANDFEMEHLIYHEEAVLEYRVDREDQNESSAEDECVVEAQILARVVVPTVITLFASCCRMFIER